MNNELSKEKVINPFTIASKITKQLINLTMEVKHLYNENY